MYNIIKMLGDPWLLYVSVFYIAFAVRAEGREPLPKTAISPVHNKLPFQDQYC